MSSNLEMKKQVVADIVEKLKSAESMVICSYSGLTVEQVTELRKQCRENDVHYCVLKNRLVSRALAELNIEGLDSLLEGPNAFVFGTKDITAAPKIISTFIEKNKLTSLEIKGRRTSRSLHVFRLSQNRRGEREHILTLSPRRLRFRSAGCFIGPPKRTASL